MSDPVPFVYNEPVDLTTHPTVCILPFVHFYYAPGGSVSGCCINLPDGQNSKSTDTEFLKLVNIEPMNSLRKALTAGEFHSSCKNCWIHEKELGNQSNREGKNLEWFDWYKKDIDEAFEQYDPNTGAMKEFKMRFMDIRFSNLCNMKCRYCSAGFSSQWEVENKKNNTPEWIGGDIPTNLNAQQQDQLMDEVIKQIPHLRIVNFAGGEPLVEERNYKILQAMIDQGRTDIQIDISTNASTMKFKQYNLQEMLSKFDDVSFNVSIDHFGDKAEYMRHGTKWNEVLENLKIFSQMSNLNFTIAASISVFNYVSFDECFYELHKAGIIHSDMQLSVNIITSPHFMSAQMLPASLKAQGEQQWRKLIQYCTDNRIFEKSVKLQSNEDGSETSVWLSTEIENMINWVNSNSTDDYLLQFHEHCRVLDNIRDENFKQTFPELAEISYA